MNIITAFCLLAFFVFSIAQQQTYFTVNMTASISPIYSLMEWSLTPKQVSLTNLFHIEKRCPSFMSSPHYLPFLGTFDPTNKKIALYAIYYPGYSYIIDLDSQLCSAWKPDVPYWNVWNLKSAMRYDEKRGLVWVCIASNNEASLACHSIMLSSGVVNSSFSITLPSTYNWTFGRSLESWTDTEEGTGFYGNVYYEQSGLGHLVFLQLLPTPKYIDLGEAPSGVPYDGLLNSNKTMLVRGGACNQGFTLDVYDIAKNDITSYYWDLSGNPIEQACTEGGTRICGISWIGRDSFISVSGAYPTPFVKFSLDPIGMQVLQSPQTNMPYEYLIDGFN